MSITPIGTTNHQSKQYTFGIKPHDRSGHVYCLGKTGVGKSTLLLNMAISDILNGSGLCILDPHGELIESILSFIPPNRIQDVVYINPLDKERLIAYNPIYKVKEENRYQVAANIVSVFKKLWSDSWGPRMEHILRNAIHSLTYCPFATLLDIAPLLSDYTFRNYVLQFVTNESLQSFWVKEFNPLSPQQKNEHIAPILNKVGILSTHPIIKAILGNVVSSFDISEIMNSKKILLCNLSKGVLGEAGTQFLGSLLVTQFQIASLERTRIPSHLRNPYYLYIDEAHSFVTLSFSDILSESRKYGLSLFITHQFIHQLHEDIYKAIIGNVGTLICFRIGTEDAETIESEFQSVFTKEDLTRLPQYSIYLKLLINGSISEPFSATTLPLNHKRHGIEKEIQEYSRKKYGISQVKEDSYVVRQEHPPFTLF